MLKGLTTEGNIIKHTKMQKQIKGNKPIKPDFWGCLVLSDSQGSKERKEIKMSYS